MVKCSPPGDGAAVLAAGLGARAGDAAEVALVGVVGAVDAAVAELGDGQARRVVPATWRPCNTNDKIFFIYKRAKCIINC